MWRAARCLQLILRQLEGCHSPICNLDLAQVWAAEQDVLWLQITVDDVVRVTVLDARNDLFEVIEGFKDWQATPINQIIKELSTLDVFKNKISGLEISMSLQWQTSNTQLFVAFPDIV